MTTCAACGQTILFGGERNGERRFCNAKCLAAGAVVTLADSLPESVVTARAWEVHNGRCPRCTGPGPVDVHSSFRVWSGLVMTSYSTRPNVCCRRCGNRARMKDALFSLAFGWWGFPWGLIWTPIQVVRNVTGVLRSEDSTSPSPGLTQLVRLQMAAAAQQPAAAAAAFTAAPR
jgi:hypothetical protein